MISLIYAWCADYAIVRCPSPLDTLHAVSALGTKVCFYSPSTNEEQAEIIPIAIPPHPTRVTDTAPADRWNYDVLQPEGAQRLLDVVAEIKAKCEDLAGGRAQGT